MFDKTDIRSSIPRFTPEARTANQVLVKSLDEIGKSKNATPGRVALAWLLAQKPWIVPIPGTTKLHRLEENIGASAATLAAEDLKTIEDAAAHVKIEGARYPEHIERMTGILAAVRGDL